ncbi:hypothetical protein, partial [Escherichia coli]|uniref:hypothetical protein n=1 Tax=Escherichia coli TaxID=562 RepID=UPI001BDC1E5F
IDVWVDYPVFFTVSDILYCGAVVMQTSRAFGAQHFSPGSLITILLIPKGTPPQYRSILPIDMIVSIGCNHFTLSFSWF